MNITMMSWTMILCKGCSVCQRSLGYEPDVSQAFQKVQTIIIISTIIITTIIIIVIKLSDFWKICRRFSDFLIFFVVFFRFLGNFRKISEVGKFSDFQKVCRFSVFIIFIIFIILLLPSMPMAMTMAMVAIAGYMVWQRAIRGGPPQRAIRGEAQIPRLLLPQWNGTACHIISLSS